MNRKPMVLLMCICFASFMALAACSGGSASSSASSSSASASGPSSSGTASSSSSSSGASSTGQASLANPWSEAANAQEAATGAGVDTFGVSADIQYADLGKPFQVTYRYMNGIAEADVDFGASQVTARKGASSQGDDISGDYNTYAYAWIDEIDGISITCQGNRQGDATKATWSDGEYRYSTSALGLGGDDNFGLNHDRLAAFVQALK